jgi:hypothetical protein
LTDDHNEGSIGGLLTDGHNEGSIGNVSEDDFRDRR